MLFWVALRVRSRELKKRTHLRGSPAVASAFARLECGASRRFLFRGGGQAGFGKRFSLEAFLFEFLAYAPWRGEWIEQS